MIKLTLINEVVTHRLYRHVTVGGYIPIIGFMVIMVITIPANDYNGDASVKVGVRVIL